MSSLFYTNGVNREAFFGSLAYDEIYVTEISYRHNGLGSQWACSLVSGFQAVA